MSAQACTGRTRGPLAAASSTPAAYFGRRHPLAEVARQLCRAGHHGGPVGLGGGVACGPCWEAAVRADERFAVAFDLPSEPPAADWLCPDPVAVDLAIAKARAGEPVRGLRIGVRAVLARMIRDGQLPWRPFLARFGMSGSEALRLAALADEHAAGSGPEVAA